MFDPRDSLRLWKRRLKHRRKKHARYVAAERKYTKENRPVLAKRAHRLRRKWSKLVDEAERMVKARSRQVRARLRSDRKYAGARYVTNRINDLAKEHRPGTRVTSRKRPTLLGNIASDHNLFNRTADAIDHALVNDHGFKRIVVRDLTNGSVNDIADFGTITVRNPQNGRDYRVQLIAGTHGTGPHHHSGAKLI
jgi:hypothetical protein